MSLVERITKLFGFPGRKSRKQLRDLGRDAFIHTQVQTHLADGATAVQNNNAAAFQGTQQEIDVLVHGSDQNKRQIFEAANSMDKSYRGCLTGVALLGTAGIATLLAMYGCSGKPADASAKTSTETPAATVEENPSYKRNYPNSAEYHIDILVGNTWYAEKDVPKDAKPTKGRFYIKGDSLGYGQDDIAVEVELEALPKIKEAIEIARKADLHAGKLTRYTTEYKAKAMAQMLQAIPDMDDRGTGGIITTYDADAALNNANKGKQGLTK